MAAVPTSPLDVGTPDGRQALVGPLVDLCNEAAAAILAVYAGGFDVTTKNDRSPVTAADLAAHHVLCDGLATLTPDIPVLSEESADIPWSVRRAWRRFWLVDPLDGTREFIKRNGEFTVNVALIEDGVSVLGIVQEPVTGVWHVGHVGTGLWRGTGPWQPQAPSLSAVPVPRPQGRLRVALSRSHHTGRAAPLLAAWPVTEEVALGSSLKYCRMVDGELDAYPRLGPTSGWDTAAAHAVLVAGGGCLVDASGAELRYNQDASLLNPCFLALGDARQLPSLLPAFQVAAETTWR